MKRWRGSYVGAEFLYAIEVKLKLASYNFNILNVL